MMEFLLKQVENHPYCGLKVGPGRDARPGWPPCCFATSERSQLVVGPNKLRLLGDTQT